MNNKKFHKSIAAQVRALRTLHNLTQEQLGEKVGVHMRTIRRIEAGTNNSTIEIIKDIADCFNLKLSAFLAKAGC